MFWTMTHENINVSCLHVSVRPDHWVIAHLLVGSRRISLFINAGEHVDIRPRRGVVGVPLFVFDHEGRDNAFHHRVILVLNGDRTRDEACDVILEADASHELVKPGPHLETVELSQESSVVKSDPTAFALFDIFD